MSKKLVLILIFTLVAIGTQTVSTQQANQPAPPACGGGGAGVTPSAPGTEPAGCNFGKLALASDRQGLLNQVQQMKAKIGGDQEALCRLRLQDRQADFDEWSKLTEDAKKDLEKQRWDSAIDTLFLGAQGTIETFATTKRLLDPYTAAYAIDKLQGLNGTPVVGSAASSLETLLAKLSGTMIGKEDALKVLESASHAVDTAKFGLRTSPIPTVEDYGEGVTTVLGWLAKSNESIALAKVLQFAVSGGYDAATYYFSSENVDNLTQLTELQLRIVNMWKDRLVKDVGCLKQAEAALANLPPPPTKPTTPTTPTKAKASGGHTGLILLGGGLAAAGVAAYEVGKLKSNSSGSCGPAPTNPFYDCSAGSPNCASEVSQYSAWCKCNGFAGGLNTSTGACQN